MDLATIANPHKKSQNATPVVESDGNKKNKNTTRGEDQYARR